MKSDNQNIRPLYWSQFLANKGYNLKFGLMTFLEQCSSTKIIKNYQELFLLGEKYNANPGNLESVNQQIYEAFCKIPWMTYRAVFPEMDTNSNNYVTDTGWGCMVRVGQMLMARTLKKHLGYKTKQQMKQILALFDDYDEKQIFSIQNISKMARQEYDLLPGKWYNPTQIAFILSDLYHYQQINPYRKDLSFVIMNNASLFFDQILFKMCNIKYLCSCRKKNIVCFDCYKKQTSICLVLLARIGLDSPEKNYLGVLNKLFEISSFNGMIGGKPDRALYFVGKNFDQYIYLDPHTVNEGMNISSLDRLYDTYFCKSFRTCKNTSIDPSIGVSFYLRQLQDVDELYRIMKKIKEDSVDDFFFFLADETPHYMKTIEQQRDALQPVETESFQPI